MYAMRCCVFSSIILSCMLNTLLPAPQLGVSGILVLDARMDGPAFKSGIKGTTRDEYGRLVIGDVITAFKGSSIKGAGDLYRALDKCKIGDKVDVEVLRENAKEHVTITLEGSS